jgi:hypothetical protein
VRPASSVSQPAWLAGVGLGPAASLALGLPRRIRRLTDGRYLVRASWLPMIVILAIFGLRYVLAVELSMTPDIAHHTGLAAAAGTVYGLPTGLFAARAWYVTARHPPRGGRLIVAEDPFAAFVAAVDAAAGLHPAIVSARDRSLEASGH